LGLIAGGGRGRAGSNPVDRARTSSARPIRPLEESLSPRCQSEYFKRLKFPARAERSQTFEAHPFDRDPVSRGQTVTQEIRPKRAGWLLPTSPPCSSRPMDRRCRAGCRRSRRPQRRQSAGCRAPGARCPNSRSKLPEALARASRIARGNSAEPRASRTPLAAGPGHNHLVAYVLVDFTAEIEDWSRGDTEHAVEHRMASPVAQPLGRPRRSGHVDEKHETLLLPGRVVEPGNEANETCVVQ